MFNHDAAMLAYAQLAQISRDRQQSQGLEKLLTLCGVAACHAGWLTVAAECFCQLQRINQRHFVVKAGSFPDALRDPDLTGFFEVADRFCSFEQAEHLLSSQGGPSVFDDSAAGQIALGLLQPK